MKQIISHQEDWDQIINDNFSKFSNGNFSDNVVYLNGTKKDDGLPLWWRCYNVGDLQIFQIGGYVDFPKVASGQTIDVFNIPGMKQVEIHVSCVEDGINNSAVYLTHSDNPGTFCITNYTGQDLNPWKSKYSIIALCENH